jgi:hypothetical protein
MTFDEWWKEKDARFRAAMLKEDMRAVWIAATNAERDRVIKLLPPDYSFDPEQFAKVIRSEE